MLLIIGDEGTNKTHKILRISKEKRFAIWQLFLHGTLFELSRGTSSAQLKQRFMQEKLPILKKYKYYLLKFSVIPLSC